MTEMDEKTKRALTALPVGYDVGFGKPPLSTRFAKGQSGNRGGRPKGAKNKIPALNEERLKAIVLKEAYRDIKVNEGDRQVTLSMAEAIIRALALAAVKGEARAQALFIQLLGTVEDERKELHDKWCESLLDYKIGWDKVLAYREETGETGPKPLPHPDDVVIDRANGTLWFSELAPGEKQAMLRKFVRRADEQGRDLLDVLKEARAKIRGDAK